LSDLVDKIKGISVYLFVKDYLYLKVIF
jgi:hypothetical protein